MVLRYPTHLTLTIKTLQEQAQNEEKRIYQNFTFSQVNGCESSNKSIMKFGENSNDEEVCSLLRDG